VLSKVSTVPVKLCHYCAPTNDVLEVPDRPDEDFETTARRYAARPDAQRSFGNWLPRPAMANERWKVEQGAEFAQRPAREPGAMQQILATDSA